jgi:protochlorophyllide reductase
MADAARCSAVPGTAVASSAEIAAAPGSRPAASLTMRSVAYPSANAGLGLEIARVLADRGAEVVMACRNVAKGEAAAATITGRTEVRELDVADLDSVAAFADGFTGRLDLLVNNAGLMAIDEARTPQGVEMQFGVNHLGHYALTTRLLPRLLATPGSRIGSQSSMGHRAARGTADPLLERPYDRWQAYFQSKLANLLFTAELQRHLTVAGAETIAVAAHPGASNTDLGTEGSSSSNRLMRSLVPLVTQPAVLGVRPILRALTDPSVQGGEFYGPRFLVRGAAAVRETPSRAARDRGAAADLWALSGQLTGFDAVLGASGS